MGSREFYFFPMPVEQTFLIATHNEELANMSDRKLTIKDGIIAD